MPDETDSAPPRSVPVGVIEHYGGPEFVPANYYEREAERWRLWRRSKGLKRQALDRRHDIEITDDEVPGVPRLPTFRTVLSAKLNLLKQVYRQWNHVSLVLGVPRGVVLRWRRYIENREQPVKWIARKDGTKRRWTGTAFPDRVRLERIEHEYQIAYAHLVADYRKRHKGKEKKIA